MFYFRPYNDHSKYHFPKAILSNVPIWPTLHNRSPLPSKLNSHYWRDLNGSDNIMMTNSNIYENARFPGWIFNGEALSNYEIRRHKSSVDDDWNREKCVCVCFHNLDCLFKGKIYGDIGTWLDLEVITELQLELNGYQLNHFCAGTANTSCHRASKDFVKWTKRSLLKCTRCNGIDSLCQWWTFSWKIVHILWRTFEIFFRPRLER